MEHRLVEQPSPGDAPPVIEDGLTGHSEDRRRAWLVRNDDELRLVNRDRLEVLGERAAISLVEGTDFERSFLLIVQVVLPSRDLALRLDRVVEEDGGGAVHAYLTSGTRGEGGGGGAGEVELATLFVRCRREGTESVDRALVTYDGPGPAGTFETGN
ncbi:hypothetical protein ACFQPA_12235 [Halomarina halobia]|uniref:Uncharacterized protein n=1 Tax=Halomarina halobia TaxID=3033386 RepID=A0ABD6A9B6_9EURY|nr:hypothetical protein [Halomarina sp. PSR21]